jgi:hypothetical protein
MITKTKFTRSVFAVPLALGALAFSAPAALAATPSNDTFGGATPAVVGFAQSLDTTEATTDADDVQLNASCGAPATDASVWYSFTTGTDSGIVIDVSQSNYAAGLMVGTGSKGNLQTMICGPGAVAFFAAPGTTYYVLAFDFQGDGGGNGGLLNITFNAAPPPPTATLTVNRTGLVNSKTGIATLSGTYSCTNSDVIQVTGDASQSVGRFTINGSFFFIDFGTCDGAVHTWVADAIPFNGKFAGGKAMTVTFALACGPFECAEGFVQQTVQLKGGGKK